MKKTLATLATLITLITFCFAAQVVLAETQTHSHDDDSWQSLESAISGFAIEDNNYVMTSGNYYLANDYELARGLIIHSGVSVTICLNDHILSMVADNPTSVSDNLVTDSIFIVYGGSLTVTDAEAATARYWDASSNSIKLGSIGGTNDFVGGAITGGSNGRNVLGGGAICISSGSFTLEGGSIVGNTTEYDGILGGGVYVNGGATFTMNGGAIIGNTSGGNAGGVYIQHLGTFVMNDGVIAHNGTALTSNYGGGVYNVGNFTMNGGLIDSNFSLGGGAISTVYAGYGVKGGIFTMNGGTISNNLATGNCGAIFVGSGGTVIMNDGEIINNTTYGFGGAIGVRYDTSTVTIYNGEIINNTAYGGAGGIHVNAGTLNIGQGDASDTITIYNNTVSGVQCNVYLPTGITITEVGTLDDSCSVGVTKANGTGTAALSSTSPVYSITTSDAYRYTSDQGYYRILDGDAVILLNEGVIPGTDATITYTKDAYDLASLFDLTARHGEITYTLAAESTGTGSITDGKLSIDTIGTFVVEIATSYTITAEPKTGTATLTVTAKGVTIDELTAQSRAILEGDYSVMLDETRGSISSILGDDEVSLSFAEYSAEITNKNYQDDAALDDGAHDFTVAVSGLTLTGADAQNYEIIEIKDTTVTITKDVLNIIWPTASDIIYGQTQADYATLSGGSVELALADGSTCVITGTFTWANPSTEVQDIATYTDAVIFTPANAEDTALFSGITGAVDYTVTEVPPPDKLTATDATQIYSTDVIDVTQLDLFDLTGLGEATYTITPDTGEGSIEGNKLTVSTVGTFTITVSTAPTVDNPQGSTGTATLTITPKGVTITALTAETRGPVQNYYAVTLNDDSGSIDGIIFDDAVSIDFTTGYTATITNTSYDSVENYNADGTASFVVAVENLTLTGADAANYYIISIADTTVTIEMAIPYIAWPAATNITYGQTQAEDTALIGGKVMIQNTDGSYTDITDTGTFQWVGASTAQQEAGVYTGTVQFVETEPGTGGYHEILTQTTRSVDYLVEAAPVQFAVSNNSVEYGGYVNPTVIVTSSGTADTPVEGVDYTVSYLRLVDGVYEDVTHPVDVGTYFIGVEFTNIGTADTPNYNYFHTGTVVSTAKQIGVLVIYEPDQAPQGYDVSFTGFDAADTTCYDITDALPQTIHILPTLDTDIYLGWETALGVFYDFGSRFPQPEYDVTFTAVLAADNHTISGTVTGTDLDTSTDTTLSNIGVVLMSGNTQIATTETDAKGDYSFSVMPGRYTVEFTRDQYGLKYIESFFVDATERDVVVDVNFPDERYTVELSLAAGMDSITVDGLQAMLTELSSDKTVENSVVFAINQVDVTSADYFAILAKAAENGLTTDNVKQFYDVQITEEKILNTVTEVAQLDTTMFTCYIPLSGIYQAKESYTVYRSVGETVDLLTTEPNEAGEYIELLDDGKTIAIVANKSAVYAISFVEPAPTILTGVDATETYRRDAIDVTSLNMFDLTGLGDATYTITPVTGEGVIDGTTVDVTKVGTFTVTVTTAATATSPAMQGTATLTVEPKAVAISDLATISKGPEEDNDYVALDDSAEATIVGVINSDDVSVSYTNSYGRITQDDYADATVYDYTDGSESFTVAVGGLELTGADKDNYYIADIADTTVLILVDIPAISWPTAPNIEYHQDLTSSVLYGGKVIVLDTATNTYIELAGTFEWVDITIDDAGNTVATSDIGTYTQLVRFVEDKTASNTPSDTSYRTILESTTHTVAFTIKATSVQFEITDNDLIYNGSAQYPQVTAIASSGLDLTEGVDYNILYYQLVDGTPVYYSDAKGNPPTEVGTYLVGAEFTTSNYHHEGTLEYTAKQIGVFHIYETEPTATYTVTFDGYDSLTITGAHAEDIHILPTLADDTYSGWAYNGSVYAFGSRFPQPASDVTLTPVLAADTYTVSGTVYGVDLDGTQDTTLNKIAVAVMQGSEMIANGETDENGKFSFALPEGYYMVVITRDQVVYNEVTYHVEVTNGNISLGDIVLPDIAQNTAVEIASEVTVTSVDGLDTVLESYLKAEGTDISNTITVTIDPIDIEGSEKTEYDAILALATKSGITTNELKVFFDINVAREYDGNTTQIHTIPDGEYLTFYIPLSGIYQNKDEYIVYRYHVTEEGEVQVEAITTTENKYGEKITLSEDGQTLMVKAKYYSIYAVAYKTAQVTEDSNSGGNSTTGSTSSHAYYTVTYELNGGQGALPEVASYMLGSVVAVKLNTVLRDGYVFTGWLSSADGQLYAPNATFVMPEQDVVLTAQWSLAYNPVNVPETGDISHTALLLCVAVGCGAGMFLTRKKQKK